MSEYLPIIETRLHLAIGRVADALDRADYDSGHIITSDNVKISDVRVILAAARLWSAPQGDAK